MIVSYPKSTSQGQACLKKFTIMNQNIEREERIAGRQLPYKRYIKFYHEHNGMIYVPHAQLGTANPKEDQMLPESITYNGNLTDEQYSVVEDIIMNGKKSSLIVMKTGRGKSHIVMSLTSIISTKTLICCHNIKTLTEMKTKFQEYCGVNVGLYYGKSKEIKDITITTHTSFKKSLKEFQGKFGTVIIDEADTGVSPDLIKSLALVNCEYIFGLTATPKRQNVSQKDMELLYGDVLKIEGLENNGYNIKPVINQLQYQSTVMSYENRHDLRKQLIKNEDRKVAQRELITSLYNSGAFKFGLVLVERKEAECVEIYENFKETIDNIYIINGDTKEDEDEKNITEMLKKGKGIIIATVGKMGRGVDITPIDAVFLFFPSRFRSATIQAAGRGLRNAVGKTGCTIYDRCDMPILNSQMYERIKTYKEEYGDDVVINKVSL